jgi:hypothetical protein
MHKSSCKRSESRCDASDTMDTQYAVWSSGSLEPVPTVSRCQQLRWCCIVQAAKWRSRAAALEAQLEHTRVQAAAGAVAMTSSPSEAGLAGGCVSIFRKFDKNRRYIGKSQPKRAAHRCLRGGGVTSGHGAQRAQR